MADEQVVRVRALWPMPGVPDGSVRTVTDGPGLRKLIAAGRYQVVDEPEPTDTTEAVARPAADQVGPGSTPEHGTGSRRTPARPGRRRR